MLACSEGMSTSMLVEKMKLAAKELNEDVNTVHQIIKFQFEQIVQKMKDVDFTDDILINNLFKFKLKTRYKNNKSLKYCSHES